LHYHQYLLFFHVGRVIGKLSTSNELIHYWQQIGSFNILVNIKQNLLHFKLNAYWYKPTTTHSVFTSFF